MKVTRACALGDRVEVDGAPAEVVAVRQVGEQRQVLTLRLATGGTRFVTADVMGAGSALPPVSMATAVGIAQLIVGGTDPRMPVSMVHQILATALLAATSRTQTGGAR